MVISALLQPAYVSSNFTWSYGAPGKVSFQGTQKEVVELVAEVIQDKFPYTTSEEVNDHFKSWFKYVVQETRRVYEKQMKKQTQ